MVLLFLNWVSLLMGRFMSSTRRLSLGWQEGKYISLWYSMKYSSMFQWSSKKLTCYLFLSSSKEEVENSWWQFREIFSREGYWPISSLRASFVANLWWKILISLRLLHFVAMASKVLRGLVQYKILTFYEPTNLTSSL